MSTATRAGQPAPGPHEIGVTLPAAARPRLESIDLMRGIVIVLMALDHTRDYVGTSTFDPLNADVTNLPIYLTRWITHFCAPTFCFLMGIGAYLAGRARTRAELSLFLLSRGLWLVFLEITVIKFALQLNFSLDMTLALVFWSLGWSLVFVSALVFLPSRFVGAIGVVMIMAHNVCDGIQPEIFGPFRPLWLILHQRGVIELTSQIKLMVVYPLIPWVGVAAAGFGFGEIMTINPRRRQTVMIALGLIMTAAFFLLRTFDFYGDPLKWSSQSSTLKTSFSFFNCQKNPASLLFLLMTLGPMFILLALLERRFLPALISRFLITFGRVPLFFFVTHLYVIRLFAFVAAAARGLLPAYLFGPGVQAPPGFNLELPWVYLWFVVVMIVMYFPCRWFAGIKARHKNTWWLSYL
jgi:uncharacterized membrane protein